MLYVVNVYNSTTRSVLCLFAGKIFTFISILPKKWFSSFTATIIQPYCNPQPRTEVGTRATSFSHSPTFPQPILQPVFLIPSEKQDWTDTSTSDEEHSHAIRLVASSIMSKQLFAGPHLQHMSLSASHGCYVFSSDYEQCAIQIINIIFLLQF